MAGEIKLQALKENVESVEVNEVKVAPGEVVAKDQALLEVQADKAALDVPSPVAGRVTEVRVKAGDQIKVGQVYCLIEPTNGEAGGGEGPAPARAPGGAPPPPPPRPGGGRGGGGGGGGGPRGRGPGTSAGPARGEAGPPPRPRGLSRRSASRRRRPMPRRSSPPARARAAWPANWGSTC